MMDEQRIQAYVELIQALLACPEGGEGELLQANGELVDGGLVGVMGQYADWMEGQGDSNAGWLRQVAAALELGDGSLSSQSQEDAAAFALEIVQLIAQTQANLLPNLEKILPSEIAADYEQKIRTLLVQIEDNKAQPTQLMALLRKSPEIRAWMKTNQPEDETTKSLQSPPGNPSDLPPPDNEEPPFVGMPPAPKS